MILDFSPKIKLEKKEAELYIYLKSLVYLASLSAGLFLFYLIFFPSQNFFFIFANPNSLDNTLISPRDQSGNLPIKNILESGQALFFNAEMREKYSDVEIEVELAKDSDLPSTGKVQLRKTYRAMLFPEGNPVGFKEGSLIRDEKNYFIISENKLRSISISLIEKLGFSEKAFVQVETADLKYNPMGEPISDSNNYPPSSLFQIESIYYILDSGKLRPFSSANAYLSQYSSDQAIWKDSAFLNDYAISNDPVGFADGSLVSSGISAFVISQKNLFPINNVITFESKGFRWEDVVPIGSDEIALYEKQKLFNIQSLHPNGVIFSDEKENAHFMIDDGTKKRIPSKNILQSWLRKSPVPFSLEALNIFRSCALHQKKLSLKPAYFCVISIKDLENLPGTGFEFESTFDSDVKLGVIDANFKKELSYSNFKSSATYFITTIMNKYVSAE